jgi:hypothetical protein
VLPLTVQIDVVVELKLTGSPEVALALTVKGELIIASFTSVPKLIVCACAVRTRFKPETETGRDESVVPPSPSWPEVFKPQHCKVPVLDRAQVSELPAAIETTPLESPVTATGEDELTVKPLPSSPYAL